VRNHQVARELVIGKRLKVFRGEPKSMRDARVDVTTLLEVYVFEEIATR